MLLKLQLVRRRGQKLHARSHGLDPDLAQLTWQLKWSSMDRALWLVAQAPPEQLAQHVADPHLFCEPERRKDTSIVMVDATAVWTKLRGEERVLLLESESVRNSGTKKARKLLQACEDPSQQQLLHPQPHEPQPPLS